MQAAFWASTRLAQTFQSRIAKSKMKSSLFGGKKRTDFTCGLGPPGDVVHIIDP